MTEPNDPIHAAHTTYPFQGLTKREHFSLELMKAALASGHLRGLTPDQAADVGVGLANALIGRLNNSPE